MAIYNDSANATLENVLKTYYAKEGLSNLLQRNDPFLKTLTPEYVEGKTANFAAIYSRGGAVSARYKVAKRLATQTARAKEFKVEPGKLFTGTTYNTADIVAARSSKGAYAPVIGTKFWASSETFRKTLASCLYASGYGELGVMANDAAALVSGTLATITLPRSAVMALDIGSEIVFKTNKSDPELEASTVRAQVERLISPTQVEVNPLVAGAIASKVVCIAGGVSDDGKPLFPVGLAGWIPDTVATTDSFFGVNRSVARDRLAGTVINRENNETALQVIERAILMLRAAGSTCDTILMNDEDYLDFKRIVDSKTYFQNVDGGKAKGKAELGFKDYGLSVSTNYLENIIDTPYCPKGKVYILDSKVVKMWVYTNTEILNKDQVNGNEAGKQTDVTGSDTDLENKPYQLLLDNLITVQPGTDTDDGAAAFAALNFFGQFVITNPSVCGVVNL